MRSSTFKSLDELSVANVIETYQYWTPESQYYAGGDVLITLLRDNWQVAGDVIREHITYGAARLSTIFHFHLHNGSDELRVPVIRNPFVLRLIKRLNLKVVQDQQEKVKEGTE